MPNVVVDASSLIGALLKSDSIPEKTLRLARARDVICMSDEVEPEIRAVFSRPSFADATRSGRSRMILDILLGAAVWYYPAEAVLDCRDAKDNKYLELALAAGVGAILSSDNDLTVLSPWRGIPILRPAEYLALYGPGPSPDTQTL